LKGKIVNCFYDGAGGGLGDFIRGSVYLYGHCKSRGLDFDFDLSKHPINKYISSNCDIEYDVGDIDCLYNKAVEHKRAFLSRIKRFTEGALYYTKDDETKLIYSNFHYYVQSGRDMINAMNSMPPLSRGCCNWFIDNIKFESTVNKAVDETLFKNNLKIGEFNIVHFRIGDQNSFGDKNNSENYFKICSEHCSEISKKSNLPLVVLSDSNELKEYLDSLDSNYYVFHLESQHTQSSPAQSGLDLSISEDGVFYVAFDAKLLTLAKKVYSYSVYTHGSGFVFWMCKIFGIDVEMNLLNMPKTKIPVFFHIPKNAGTYVYNVSFRLVASRLNVAGRIYNLQVKKGGLTAYRLICSAKNVLSEKYKKINKTNDQAIVVDYDDLELDDLNLHFVEVCSSSFGSYKEELYKKLPNNVEPYEFLLLREVYSRILSIYSYLTSPESSHEPTSGLFGNKTFIEYLNSDQLESSWLIKSLLNLPEVTVINENHYRNACDILEGMLVCGVSATDSCLSTVFKKCHDFQNIELSNQKIYRNKTNKKTEQPFNTLDEATKAHFIQQTKWDRLLYEKFTNNKTKY